MNEYTLPTGMTWERLGEIVRTGFLSGYDGAILAVREAEFDAWKEHVERDAAARALEGAAEALAIYAGTCLNASSAGNILSASAAKIRNN